MARHVLDAAVPPPAAISLTALVGDGNSCY